MPSEKILPLRISGPMFDDNEGMHYTLKRSRSVASPLDLVEFHAQDIKPSFVTDLLQTLL